LRHEAKEFSFILQSFSVSYMQRPDGVLFLNKTKGIPFKCFGIYGSVQ